MSRTIRLVTLVTAASVLGACSRSPTGPADPDRQTSVTRLTVPVQATADDVCDWTNPWSCH